MKTAVRKAIRWITWNDDPAPGRIGPASRLMLWLYDVGLLMGACVLSPAILPLIWATEKYRATAVRRLWCRCPDTALDSDGTVSRLWIHALSVGEIHAARALVDKVQQRRADIEIVLSVSTHSGLHTARQVFAGRKMAIVLFPYDFSFSVRAAARWVRPTAVILTETDIWPNFLAEMKRRSVPVNLINLRFSDTTYCRYGRFPWIARKVFGTFASICVQSRQDACRLIRLGVDPTRVHVTGNIKFDSAIGAATPAIDALGPETLGFRAAPKVVVAGSTHAADEAALRQMSIALREKDVRLLLVLVPRDPGRSGTIVARFKSVGLDCCRLSELPPPDNRERPGVVVVDAMGLLKELYAIADLVFVGGSMGRDGGHNPLEAAAWKKPILFGPDMSDFRQISRWLLQSGGALQVEDASALTRACRMLLDDADRAITMGRRAHDVFCMHQGTVDRVFDALAIPNHP